MGRLISEDGLLELFKDEERYGYVTEEDIRQQPTADPRVHAKWKVICGGKAAICTNCNEIEFIIDTRDKVTEPSERLCELFRSRRKYCPCCGAIMDLE